MLIDEFVAKVHAAVGSGSPEAMAQVIDPEALVWENIDGKTRTFAEAGRFHEVLAQLLDSFSFEDVRVTATDAGYVEQHTKVFVRKRAPFRRRVYRSPACMVVTVVDGQIRKVEEYLDAASFPPEIREARRRADHA